MSKYFQCINIYLVFPNTLENFTLKLRCYLPEFHIYYGREIDFTKIFNS